MNKERQEEFDKFVENVERICRPIPEDLELFHQVHKCKPLVEPLAKLFGDNLRIKIPVEITGADSWDDKFKNLFADFWANHGKNTDLIAGKVLVDGQPQKLFKFLPKHYGMKSIDELEKFFPTEIRWLLNNKPSNKAETYITLSRDPMDFYMLSTNQAFTSCMRLDGQGFWTGIMNRLADPHAILAYIEDVKDEATYKVDEAKIKSNALPNWFKPFKLTSPKMVGRSWANFNGMDGDLIKLYLPRFFGTAIKEQKTDQISFIKKTDYTSEKYRVIRCYEKSPIVIPNVYLDNQGVQVEGNTFRNARQNSGRTGELTSRSGIISMAQRIGESA